MSSWKDGERLCASFTLAWPFGVRYDGDQCDSTEIFDVVVETPWSLGTMEDWPAGNPHEAMTYSGQAEMPCSCRSRPSSSPSRLTRRYPVALMRAMISNETPNVAEATIALPIAWAINTCVPP